MSEKYKTNYEEMASFNVIFFDIQCDFEKLASVLDAKVGFEHQVNNVKYCIVNKENITIDNRDLILLEIEKYNKKPVTMEAYDSNNSKIDNIDMLSNRNYCLFDIKKKVCLLQTNKNGASISTLQDLISSNNIGFHINFTLKIDKKDWKDLKDIKRLTVSQKGSRSLFSVGEKWLDRWNIDLGTVTIKITAKRGGSLPINIVRQEANDITMDYTSFNIKHSEGIYDLIKHKLYYTNIIPQNSDKDWYKNEIQIAYQNNISKI